MLDLEANIPASKVNTHFKSLSLEAGKPASKNIADSKKN